MKKAIICVSLLIIVSCLAATRSNAQQTFLFSQSSCNQGGVDCESTVDLAGGMILGYSATEVDYWTSYEYSAYVDGQLSDQSGTIYDSQWDEEDFIAEVYTSAPANPGMVYTQRGYHYVIARYYYEEIVKGPDGCAPCDGCNTDCYYYYNNWWWWDPFGFHFANIGYYGSWWNLWGFGPPYEVYNDETISLGQTSESVFVGWRITSILPSRGAVGTTVGVAIFGSGFSQSGSNHVSVSGYGVTAREVNFISSGLLSANFEIASDASAGNHSVRVTINGFPSNSLNFLVQAPTSLVVVPGGVTVIPSNPFRGCWNCYEGNDTGIQIAIQYQVLDQHGDPILNSAMRPQETLSSIYIDGSHRNDIVSDVGGSCYPGSNIMTDSNGRFIDAPLGWCTNGVTSTFSMDQAIRIMVGSSEYTVRSQHYSGSSSGPGSGTISNGGDISASRP